MNDQRRRAGPGLRQHAVLAWLRLARVYQKIDARSERFFRAQGLNTAQFDVLAKVGAASGITQQELADALLVTKGNISQLLRRMEHDGLVARRHVGRANCLFLTERGEALFDRAVPAQEALVASLLAPLAADEQRELLRLLRKLDHGMAG
ncbi:MAG TPA: MarR family transcriptional regulator [Chloroflexaceae bacterium]|nr:MarR family transcriptional regulator [Chloroflexaceae bacterium]